MEVEMEGGSSDHTNNNRDNIPTLLASARQHIIGGNPTLALQSVVMAMKLCGGDQAVMWTLHRAHEMYKSRMKENAAAEELASLFAECAITEATPSASGGPSPFTDTAVGGSAVLADRSEASILAQSGRMQVVMDAFADGSSFVCLQCGGLVSNLRRDEHFAYWCGAS